MLAAGRSEGGDEMPGVSNGRLDAVGSTLGRYHLLGILGQGGMGAVYRAFDPELARVVAVKVIRLRDSTDISPTQLAELRSRLVREARSLAALSHPNIVTVYDVGLVDGVDPFLAMEFLGGKNLRAQFNDKRADRKQVFAAYLGIAQGLAAAHAAGIVHRDIKPENCVAADDGRYCVIDFGLVTDRTTEAVNVATLLAAPSTYSSPGWIERLAFALGIRRSNYHLEQSGAARQSLRSDREQRFAGTAEQLTHVGGIVGTSSYMAPEQALGEGATARSDVFSFCLSFFEALVGKNPFAVRDNLERISRIARAELHWPHNIPRYIRTSLEAGLHFDPMLRPGDIGEWLKQYEDAHRRAVKKQRMVLGGCIVGVVATMVSQIRNTSLETIDCDSQVDRVLWEGVVAREVRAHLQRNAPSVAADVSNRLDTRLSSLDSDFQSLYRAKCVLETKDEADWARELPKGLPFDELSQVDLPLFGQCLAHREAAFRALLNATQSSTALNDVLRLPAIASALPSPTECIDTNLYRNEAPQPTQPKSILEAQAIREKIVTARMLVDQGRIPEGVRGIEELGPQVHALDFVPLSAEWWAELARAKLTPGAGGSIEESVRWFEDALILAISGAHRKVAADVSTELAVLRTYHLNERDAASDLLERAEAYVRAAGMDARQAASLDRALAIESTIQAHYADGLVHFRHALERIRSVAPEGSGREAMLLDDVPTCPLCRVRGSAPSSMGRKASTWSRAYLVTFILEPSSHLKESSRGISNWVDLARPTMPCTVCSRCARHWLNRIPLNMRVAFRHGDTCNRRHC